MCKLLILALLESVVALKFNDAAQTGFLKGITLTQDETTLDDADELPTPGIVVIGQLSRPFYTASTVCTNAQSSPMPSSGSYTIYVEIFPSSSDKGGILGWGNFDGVTSNAVNGLQFRSPNSISNYWCGDDFVVTTKNLFDSNWHSIQVTYDSTKRVQTMYVDGAYVTQRTPTSVWNVPAAYSNNLCLGGAPVADSTTPLHWEYFNGQIRHLTISGKSLPNQACSLSFAFNSVILAGSKCTSAFLSNGASCQPTCATGYSTSDSFTCTNGVLSTVTCSQVPCTNPPCKSVTSQASTSRAATYQAATSQAATSQGLSPQASNPLASALGSSTSQAYQCTCSNGTAATGSTCTANTEKCSVCGYGFYLTNSATCLAYKCTCSFGVAATGSDCTGNQHCISCNSGYYLNSQQVCAETSLCTCSNGKAATMNCQGQPEKCSYCMPGFQLSRKLRCEAI